MRALLIALMVLAGFSVIHCQTPHEDTPQAVNRPAHKASLARQAGTIASDRLVECSGIDISMKHEDLLWAINDSGDGPYIYALGTDGRNRGRVKIAGAVNRDWEDLATFKWQNQAMILVADVGDNRERRGTYMLYVVEEPPVAGGQLRPQALVNIAWTIAFQYPDKSHDAEAVAVDPASETIIILTKRDTPPLLFSLPLKPADSHDPILAHRIGAMDQIPPPTADDLLYPYGEFRSQPTAMDLTADGLKLLVLTYKQAYLFNRLTGDGWQVFSGARPLMVPLPLPQTTPGFGQRESGCFSFDDSRLWVASEGRHAGLYQVPILK